MVLVNKKTLFLNLNHKLYDLKMNKMVKAYSISISNAQQNLRQLLSKKILAHKL